jgi:hypothetical protein
VTTIIKKCTTKCKHEYQDKTYGKGKRVHNFKTSKDLPQKYTCTVCENVRT